MDLNSLPIFAMMTKRMSWLGKRQEILAQNIANADTPGYKPSDLVALRFRDMLRPQNQGLALRMTSGTHMVQTRRAPEFRNDKMKDTYETAPDGNKVVVEEQLMKVSETQGGYRLATNLYRKHVDMLRAAIGRAR